MFFRINILFKIYFIKLNVEIEEFSIYCSNKFLQDIYNPKSSKQNITHLIKCSSETKIANNFVIPEIKLFRIKIKLSKTFNEVLIFQLVLFFLFNS